MRDSDSLSQAQMGHLLADNPYGFSVKAYGPDVGARASHGYMVATEGQGQDYAPKASVDDAMGFMSSREAVLRQPDKYLGGYQGEEPPRTALDVAQKHPDTFTGHLGAANQAIKLNQESYGHLGAPDEYTDLANPHYQPGAGHHARVVSLEQMGTAILAAHARHPNEGIDSPAPSRSAALEAPSRLR